MQLASLGTILNRSLSIDTLLTGTFAAAAVLSLLAALAVRDALVRSGREVMARYLSVFTLSTTLLTGGAFLISNSVLTTLWVFLMVLAIWGLGVASWVSLRLNLGMRPITLAAMGVALSAMGSISVVEGNLFSAIAEGDLLRTERLLSDLPESPSIEMVEQQRENLISSQEEAVDELGPARVVNDLGLALLIGGLVELSAGAVDAASRLYWRKSNEQ